MQAKESSPIMRRADHEFVHTSAMLGEMRRLEVIEGVARLALCKATLISEVMLKTLHDSLSHSLACMHDAAAGHFKN